MVADEGTQTQARLRVDGVRFVEGIADIEAGVAQKAACLALRLRVRPVEERREILVVHGAAGDTSISAVALDEELHGAVDPEEDLSRMRAHVVIVEPRDDRRRPRAGGVQVVSGAADAVPVPCADLDLPEIGRLGSPDVLDRQIGGDCRSDEHEQAGCEECCPVHDALSLPVLISANRNENLEANCRGLLQARQSAISPAQEIDGRLWQLGTSREQRARDVAARDGV